MNAELIPAARPMTVCGFALERTGLVLAGEPSFQDWQALGDYLRHIEGALQWWVGDWLLYGEQSFGQEFSQFLTGYSEDTLKVCQWVASRIPKVRRRNSLNWSQHREVAALPPEQQDRLLDLAEQEGLSSRGIRLLVKQTRGEALPPAPETPLQRLRQAWRDASAGERHTFISEVNLEAEDATP